MAEGPHHSFTGNILFHDREDSMTRAEARATWRAFGELMRLLDAERTPNRLFGTRMNDEGEAI
jgi:hypothetical protein